MHINLSLSDIMIYFIKTTLVCNETLCIFGELSVSFRCHFYVLWFPSVNKAAFLPHSALITRAAGLQLGQTLGTNYKVVYLEQWWHQK